MADHQRRFAGLNFGHPGVAAYLPSEVPGNNQGTLHTTRVTTSDPNFEIAGPLTELCPPSKVIVPTASAQAWKERKLQERWLSNSHPEAFVGGLDATLDCLKENMSRFQQCEDLDHDGPLLAIGEMTDLTLPAVPKGSPLLAVATGGSGQNLRLTRIEDATWQWGNHGDFSLRLSDIDPLCQEQSAVWSGDGLPISKIKFATASAAFGSIRWLLVQTQTSITILQPEFHRLPVRGNEEPESSSFQRPSFLCPNPLITLHHHDTGGNELSDVCFRPPVPGSHPQLAVIDQCGFWSIWSISGLFQLDKNRLRLSLYKCGHISDGVLDSLPRNSNHLVQRHGIIQIGQRNDQEPHQVFFKREEQTIRAIKPSGCVLLWNAQRLALLNQEMNLLYTPKFPVLRFLDPSTPGKDQILDIQQSPINDNHVFILTTCQVVWLDLLPDHGGSGTTIKPDILLMCSHFGIRNEEIHMSQCATSQENSDGNMVFIHYPAMGQLAVYWFYLDPATKLPKWHRHFTSSPSGNEQPPMKTQRVMVQHASLERSALTENAASSPGLDYVQNDVKFYQILMLKEDLSLHFGIVTSSKDVASEVTLPTVRVGWTDSEQQSRWRRRRKHFLKYLGNVFVIPDGMTDDNLESLMTRQQEKVDFIEDSEEESLATHRPVTMNLARICRVVSSSLQDAVAKGACGLPAELVTSIRRYIENGTSEGFLPLMSWMQPFADDQGSTRYNGPEDGMETEIEALLDEVEAPVVIAQLRRQASGELPGSLLGYPSLLRKFSELWLEPATESASIELQRVRRIWVSELARDFFLSSYGVMVQSVALFGADGGGQDGQAKQDQPSQLPHSGPGLPPSTPVKPASENSAGEDAFQRLRLLAPSLKPGKLGKLKAAEVLSYWPAERGVDVDDYMSSVAIATEEKSAPAKLRQQRLEAKRKAKVKKYTLPALPARRHVAEGEAESSSRQPAAQIMSSQQRVPDSSQSQSFFGPSMALSQPVSGAFGDRKRAKKAKRKSGFR